MNGRSTTLLHPARVGQTVCCCKSAHPSHMRSRSRLLRVFERQKLPLFGHEFLTQSPNAESRARSRPSSCASKEYNIDVSVRYISCRCHWIIKCLLVIRSSEFFVVLSISGPRVSALELVVSRCRTMVMEFHDFSSVANFLPSGFVMYPSCNLTEVTLP